MIIKNARKGLTPSQIGVTLRDSNGIPQVRFVTGNKILRILKSHGTLSILCWQNAFSYILSLLLFSFLLAFVRTFAFCVCLLFGDRTWPIHP